MKQLRAILRRLGLLFGWIALIIGLALVALISWAAYLEYGVSRWDKKIDALCAANGGQDVATRIHEKVMAPETKEYFRGPLPNQSFRVPWRYPGKALGPEHPYVIETLVIEVLHEKNPSVVKYTERIVRVSDNKILAERFAYQRGGGGMPWFDPGTNHICPPIYTYERLEVNTFINHPWHEKRTIK